MAKRYEDRYGRGSHSRDRDHAHDRGYMDRASDEVRSWFGDDDAERRRHMDEQRGREREPRYGNELTRDDQNRSEWHAGEQGRREWNHSDYRQPERNRQPSERPETWHGRTGDDRSRYDDWSRTWAASDGDRDRSMRDRDWSSQGESGNRPPMSRHGGSTWSTDEGRMEFGTPMASSREARSTPDEQRWGRGPKGYQRSDARLHEEVCDRLTFSDVDAENVEVSVSNGEVTLSGTVRDRWDKRRAEDLAEEVSGVRDVHNSIRVHRPERGIGQSESSATDQPGTVLGVNPTAEASGSNTRRRS